MAQARKRKRIESEYSVRYTEIVDGNTVRVSAAPAQADPRRQEQLQRNRERMRSMNMRYVLFLTAAAVLSVAVCINYLKLQAKSTQLQKQTVSLQTQLKDIEMENDTIYNEIVSGVDLNQVKEVAMDRLGMDYPTEDQIVEYNEASGDYVKQYEEIPG